MSGASQGCKKEENQSRNCCNNNKNEKYQNKILDAEIILYTISWNNAFSSVNIPNYILYN